MNKEEAKAGTPWLFLAKKEDTFIEKRICAMLSISAVKCHSKNCQKVEVSECQSQIVFWKDRDVSDP